jgi:TatA/E family protein of Tat protein translocase
MFGPLGVPELLFIFALALLIFGPRELPKIGRTIGKSLAELRKASTELQRTLNTELLQEELRESDPRRALRKIGRDLEKSVEEAGTEESPADSAEPAAEEKDEAGEEGMKLPEIRSPEGSLARGEAIEPTAGEVDASSEEEQAKSDPEP